MALKTKLMLFFWFICIVVVFSIFKFGILATLLGIILIGFVVDFIVNI